MKFSCLFTEFSVEKIEYSNLFTETIWAVQDTLYGVSSVYTVSVLYAISFEKYQKMKLYKT